MGPRQPILSALPTTVLVSAAAESLAVPLVVLLTLLALRSGKDDFLGLGWWLGLAGRLAGSPGSL